MNIQRKTFLNIAFDDISREELLVRTVSDAGVMVTPNVDHLILLQKNKLFYDAYQSANYVICDSRVLKLLSYLPNIPKINHVIPGSSFFPEFCKYNKCNDSVTIFLLGAAEGVAKTAREKINIQIGREIVVGAHSPSFGFERNESECEEIIDIINASGATVLLVGVGAPKQELWIAKYRNRLPNIKLFLPLGATIDFEAGNVKRAPIFFQRMSLEWFYRMLIDPKRLIKRYLIDDIKIFYYVFLQIIGRYKNPFA